MCMRLRIYNIYPGSSQAHLHNNIEKDNDHKSHCIPLYYISSQEMAQEYCKYNIAYKVQHYALYLAANLLFDLGIFSQLS